MVDVVVVDACLAHRIGIKRGRANVGRLAVRVQASALSMVNIANEVDQNDTEILELGQADATPQVTLDELREIIIQLVLFAFNTDCVHEIGDSVDNPDCVFEQSLVVLQPIQVEVGELRKKLEILWKFCEQATSM